MPKLTIDGMEIEVQSGLTVLQACEQAGVEIPRFCYHERLSIAGNCRMCLVEMERAPKPVASCAMPVGDGMVIKTNTETVKKARKGVMEFLLINHPLDCPICDQGGECDLQDQSIAFGFDHSRYSENKRAVPDKDFGPLISTSMTRCIHCTRCVRFSTEIGGVEELGLVNRGEHAEISTYVSRAISTELSGNMIDLCPVGALTSKPYAYVGRSWELKKTESIDVMDAVGTNIRVDARGGEVLRILPRLHEDVNEEWLSDKGRFSCDGLKKQRLDRPYVRGKDGKLKPSTWQDALTVVAEKIKASNSERLAAIAGDLCDAESMLALKGVMQSQECKNIDCRQDGSKLGHGPRSSYLFNSGISGIDEADAVLIIGSNVRWEAPIINARLRKRYLQAETFSAASIGPNWDPNFACDMIGAGPDAINDIAAGRHPFNDVLRNAKNPMIIMGAHIFARQDGKALLGMLKGLAEATGVVKDGWNGFNILHSAASRVGGLDLGFLPESGGKDTCGIIEACEKGEIDLVYLLGADEIDFDRLGNAAVIYQGHHGDKAAHRADVILPGAAYTEKDGTYVNTEGRVQLARAAAFPPGEAKEDWKILRALSSALGKDLPYNDLGSLRQNMVAQNSIFQAIDSLESPVWGDFGTKDDFLLEPFEPAIENYYMTDPISRASETMAACTESFVLPQQGKTGTDG